MEKWLRRIGAVVLMGAAWGVVWAPIAILIGTKIVDPDNSMDEMWVMVGALPGFLCGALFCVLGTKQGRRRLDELSLPRSAAWGAVSGLLVGVLPFFLGSQNSNGRPLWLLPAMVIASLTLLSAVSAVVTVLVARMGKKGALLDANADVA
jgi:peptidoglycan/LPS O-acetylase OafA/YrhL